MATRRSTSTASRAKTKSSGRTGRRGPAKSSARRAAGRASSGGAGTDALALLKADHERVTKLFRRFDRLDEDDAQRQTLAEEICRELEVHARLEEEIFYPAARAAIRESSLIDEATVEHGSLKRLVADLRSPGADGARFSATVKVLSEYVKHHVREEEGEVFPQARRAKLDLKGIGMRIAERKRELQGESRSEDRGAERSGSRPMSERLVGGNLLQH